MNFLQILPLTRGRLDILLEIYLEKEDYLRNISKKLKINPSQTFQILNKLYGAKFIRKRKIGKEVLYSLDKNRDYKILIKILEEYHLEKTVEISKNLKTVFNLLINNRELIDSSEKILIFGSYVSGSPTKKSDIDILFINENKKLVGKSCREISLITGKDLNPLIYTKEKFNSDLEKNEPLLSSIVDNFKNRIVVK